MKIFQFIIFIIVQLELQSRAINNPSLPISWSNRLGLTITPIGTGIWAAERPFIWNNIDVGGRSIIARLPKEPNEDIGKLLVHSPVEWTAELGEALKQLGRVGVLIAPNYEHLKYIKQWSHRYPDAQVWACPDLPRRMPDVRWTHELSSDPQNTPYGIESLWFDCEINPFTGRPFFNECVFYHKQSKAAFLTDIFWNYPSSDRPNYDGISGTGSSHECPKVPAPSGPLPSITVPAGTTLWKSGMDRVYLPFYKGFMVGKSGERREKYEQRVAQLLAWDIELVVPCHGDIMRGRDLCRQVLQSHFLG